MLHHQHTKHLFAIDDRCTEEGVINLFTQLLKIFKARMF
ncbi:Uncharacterised protein [Vibrio cholerae]|nr:Uncharacterised protein [Vibrio cholerae]